MQYQQVLDFWFSQLTPKDWFAKNADLDARIEQQFSSLLTKATQGECWLWRQTAQGRLAEIIVLDQFSRNIYRDRSEAFSADGIALILAQEAVHLNDDTKLSEIERPFMYMPYMHSESALIHQQAVPLFEQCSPSHLEFELRHKAIIDEFGRYPHRNALLGRQSTPEEQAFLTQPGSRF
ncbi:DUF924 domain-containing protein [Shewanella sp. NIFS-20-20]|nr:DUF924 domain-containing protein [Shewanella sp. NIFS-20-20]